LILVNISDLHPYIGLVQQKDPHQEKQKNKKLKPLEIDILKPFFIDVGKCKNGDSLNKGQPSQQGNNNPPVAHPKIMCNDIEQTNNYSHKRDDDGKPVI